MPAPKSLSGQKLELTPWPQTKAACLSAPRPWPAQHAVFRAIENGYALVRQASNGLAMTVDDEGNVLAATDYYTTDQQTMIASVPMRGVWTVYAHVGDLFVWLCLAGWLFLVGFAVF